jgi:hypothetical protein
MTKLGLLGVAVALSTALASPVMAQQASFDPGSCAQSHPNADCRNIGHTQRRTVYRDSYNRWDGERGNRDTGFWPGGVAAGVAGGVVGTAAAIATAPIGGDAYMRNNGFVCQPGTWFRGEDGRRHICQ